MLDLTLYDFMLNAAAAGAIVSVVAGAVGYFLVLRGEAFAGHALSHVGFTGATGAVLLGLPPLGGLVLMSAAAGLVMGAIGTRLAERDVAIGVVLSVSLGFGLLFLNFFTAHATEATALLFGDILGVAAATVPVLLAGGVLCLLLLGLIARPLLFASLHPELAAARGLPVRLLSVLFLGLAGLATAGCVQIVGVLLVFSLTVGPAAAAQRWCRGIRTGLACSVALSFGLTAAGLVLAVLTDWPVSFWISLGSGLAYAASTLKRAA